MASACPAIKKTTKYELFTSSAGNRPVNMARHHGLRQSMTTSGFLKVFPIVCVRDATGKLEVKDGQHRLALAAELGLPVYYVESDEAFDVAAINSAAKGWLTDDYAHVHSAAGLKPYQDAIAFAKTYGLPVGPTFGILAGTGNISAIREDYVAGRFEIRDLAYATAVGTLYSGLATLAPAVRTRAFMAACVAVCRVPEFDPKRMLKCARMCLDKLVAYGSRPASLAMLEEVYNFKQSTRVGLKSQAEMAMRARNPATAKKAAG